MLETVTSLVAWVGVDTHGRASLYLASDSRITWGGGAPARWDHARKLFASSRLPDILGYCGDVLFPTQVLGQVTALLDGGLLYGPDAGPEERASRLREILQDCGASYPKEQRAQGQTTILHAYRLGVRTGCEFHLSKLTSVDGAAWAAEPVPLPEKSDIAYLAGSGSGHVRDWSSRWDKATGGPRTSRGVFGAFCEALGAGGDAHSGGPPQLVGLYRIGAARTFGVIFHGRRHVHGLAVTAPIGDHHLEWRDDLFQRCDPTSMMPLGDAQRHVRPGGI
jgi:hypothetical protein